VRKTLGAKRGRLFAQVLAESLVLSIAGGAIGVGLAYVARSQILALGATSIPRVADVTIDGRVLLFIRAASLLTGVLFGIAPV
jgi:putative ABC transport system permease protein